MDRLLSRLLLELLGLWNSWAGVFQQALEALKALGDQVSTVLWEGSIA